MPKEMDLSQIAQMVQWLDEERRKSKEEQSRLIQHVSSLTGELEEQKTRLQQLEADLSDMQGQVTQMAALEDALTQLKKEMYISLKQRSTEIKEAANQAEKARLADREYIMRRMDSLEEALRDVPRLEENLKAREAEDERLGEGFMDLRQRFADLGKDVEEKTRSVLYMTEQVDKDHQRIAQLQGETLELRKQQSKLRGQLSQVSERQERHKDFMDHLSQDVVGISKSHKEFIEKARLVDADRERRMEEWATEWEKLYSTFDQFKKQMETFADRYRVAGEVLKEIKQFQESIRREQNQVVQLQRLAEERQQKRLMDFLDENERRWKKQELSLESQWKTQDKINNELKEQLPKIDAELKRHMEMLRTLWRVNDLFGAHLTTRAQQWLGELEQVRANWEKTQKR